MPRMPTAIWTVVATNPVIARASDRFRLHYAGAERANQTDQQQDCYQPSKHASLPSSASPRLHGPNRVGQVFFIYVKFLCLRKTASAANSDAHPRNSGPRSATRRGRTRSLSRRTRNQPRRANRLPAAGAPHLPQRIPDSRVAVVAGCQGRNRVNALATATGRLGSPRRGRSPSTRGAGWRGSRCAVRERRRGRLP
jgi:hypothetical protein